MLQLGAVYGTLYPDAPVSYTHLPSDIVEDVRHGLEIAEQIGYPVVLRPAYTLGGSGGGIAQNPEQCAEILENGLRPVSYTHLDVYKRQLPCWR